MGEITRFGIPVCVWQPDKSPGGTWQLQGERIALVRGGISEVVQALRVLEKKGSAKEA